MTDVIVRFDGSDRAGRNLDGAIAHARANGCGVHVLQEHAGPPGQDADATAAAVLSDAVAKLRHAGVPFSGEILGAEESTVPAGLPVQDANEKIGIS